MSRGSMELWDGTDKAANTGASPSPKVKVSGDKRDVVEEAKEEGAVSPDSDLINDEVKDPDCKPSRAERGSKHSDSPPEEGIVDDASEDDYEDDFD